MESRGFIFSAPMAYQLGAGLVPVRKLGKLPAETITVEYALEYGSNTLEIHRDAIQPGQRVLIVDDLLATGGTVHGTIELVERLQGEVVGLAFLVELDFLKGRERLEGHRVDERHPVLSRRWPRASKDEPDRPDGARRPATAERAGDARPSADLDRRRFFRQFAADVFQTTATVVGAANALQQTSIEAASAILDPDATGDAG